MLYKLNVTMHQIRLATATIEATTGREAKDIAWGQREELFDFDPDDALYEVGEADFIPPEEPEE
jgi:hypothetical protein